MPPVVVTLAPPSEGLHVLQSKDSNVVGAMRTGRYTQLHYQHEYLYRDHGAWFVRCRHHNSSGGVREALIKSGFEGDGLQTVRKYCKMIAALAAEGARRDLIRISLVIPPSIWAVATTSWIFLKSSSVGQRSCRPSIAIAQCEFENNPRPPLWRDPTCLGPRRSVEPAPARATTRSGGTIFASASATFGRENSARWTPIECCAQSPKKRSLPERRCNTSSRS